MGLVKEVGDQEMDSVRSKCVDHSPISGNNIFVEFMQCVLTCQRIRWISSLTQAKCVLDKVMIQEAPSHTPRCINKDDLLNSRWIRRSSVIYKVTFSSNERALQANWEMVKGGSGCYPWDMRKSARNTQNHTEAQSPEPKHVTTQTPTLRRCLLKGIWHASDQKPCAAERMDVCYRHHETLMANY